MLMNVLKVLMVVPKTVPTNIVMTLAINVSVTLGTYWIAMNTTVMVSSIIAGSFVIRYDFINCFCYRY